MPLRIKRWAKGSTRAVLPTAIRRTSALVISADRGIRLATSSLLTCAADSIAALTSARSQRLGEYQTTTDTVRG